MLHCEQPLFDVMKKITVILLSAISISTLQAKVLVFKGSKTESEISIPGEGLKSYIGKFVRRSYLFIELNANNRIINVAEIDYDTKAKRYEIWQDSQISPFRMTGVVIGKDRALLACQDPDNEDNTMPDILVAEGRVSKGSIISLIFDGRTDLDSMTVKGLPLTAGGKVMTNGIRIGVLDYMSFGVGPNGKSSTEKFSWSKEGGSLYVDDPVNNFSWVFYDEYDEDNGWDRNLSRIYEKKSDATKFFNTAQYSIASFKGATFAQKISAVEALLKKQKMKLKQSGGGGGAVIVFPPVIPPDVIVTNPR
jgi:hypothetical protein